MKEKSRYGINVKFSCKLCTKCYFETVEDYIEHKKGNHLTEFQKTKCFIILEEKTLLSAESYHPNTKEAVVTAADLGLDVKVESDSCSQSHSSTSITPVKTEINESDDQEDLLNENEPLSTETSGDLVTPSCKLNKTQPQIVHGAIVHHKSPNPFCQKSSEKTSCFSRTIPSSIISDDRNSPEPIYLLPKTELVVFETQIKQEESQIIESETDPDPNGVTKTKQSRNLCLKAPLVSVPLSVKLSQQSTFQCKLCLKKCNSEPALKTHVKLCALYHPNRNSYCAQCDKLFSAGKYLNKHRLNFHAKAASDREPQLFRETENNQSCKNYSEFEQVDGDPKTGTGTGTGGRVDCNFDNDDNIDIDDPLQEIPAPPPPKKIKIKKPNRPRKIAQTEIELYGDGGLDGGTHPKPPLLYSHLIALALKNSETGSLRKTEMVKFIAHHFPYFESARAEPAWTKWLRQCLSFNNSFRKIEQWTGQEGKSLNVAQKGACRWALDPARAQEMDKSIQIQMDINPYIIRSAMRDPENLDLILRGAMELRGDFSLDLNSNEDEEDEDFEMDAKSYPKPLFSNPSLVGLALKNSQNGSLRMAKILKFVGHHFPYFESAETSWRHSFRQPSPYKWFRQIESPGGEREDPISRRWEVYPNKVWRMDINIQNQVNRNPENIRSAMRYPEKLEQMQRGELKGDFEDSNSEDDGHGEDLFLATFAPIAQPPKLKLQSHSGGKSSTGTFGAKDVSSIRPNTSFPSTRQSLPTAVLSLQTPLKIHSKSGSGSVSKPETVITLD